jgi:hypothetical protein
MLLISITGKKGKQPLAKFDLIYSWRAERKLLINLIFIRHLNGTVLGSFVRPAVLITDAYNALNNQPYRRQKDKEFGGNQLLNLIIAAL